MASHWLKKPPHFRGCFDIFAENQMRNKFAKDGPRRVGCFGFVKRPFSGRNFSPAAYAVAAHLQQGNPASRNGPEAGFERALEPHPYFAKNDLIDFHTISYAALSFARLK